MKLAKLGELTAESAPLEEQVWHTYAPVAVPSAEGVIAAVTQPETWPDYATEIGRFTPLRAGGLARPDVRDRGRGQHAHARCRSSPAAT